MARFPVETATIEQVHAAMLAGELTARDLAAACLARIDAYDKRGPAINAVLTVNPRALEQAGELDANLKHSGGLTGPLHGIPVLLKDNIETEGMPTTAGSLSLAGFTPPADAFIVRRLRAAGAVILAKVNLHEFAVWGETVSSLGGQTLNPYDLTRSPGGSSGGTGAGLAAGFGIAGIGTDTVNSVRSPASACGLVGLRPTLGLVSRDGIVPYALSQDTAGPLTRSVRDAAILLGVITGYDWRDPKTAWAVGQQPDSYLTGLAEATLAGKRLGILRSFFGSRPEHAEVNSVVYGCLDLARAAGAAFVELDADIDSGRLVNETSVHLHELDADLTGYLRSFGDKAPVHSLAEIIASGKFHPGIADNIRKAVTLSKDSADYNDRLVRQGRLRDQIMQLMAEHALDAIVYPHQKRLVVPVGQPQVERNGSLSAVTGFPTVTVPAGFSGPSPSAPLGVPVGIEFLGRPWSEQLLLAIAHGFEKVNPVRKVPVSTPAL